MTEQARRLAAAVAGADPLGALPAGARRAEVDRAFRHWTPLHPPTELIELLCTFDGTDRRDVLIGAKGPLLGAHDIAQESKRRASIAGDIAFSPSWMVICAEGWAHAAVLALSEPRERSAVLDLSYGDQAYPIVSSSLTALVASSADAWERGLFPKDYSRATHEELLRRSRDHHEKTRDLLTSRNLEFPSDDGLTNDDFVGPWRQSWPVGWAGRDDPDLLDDYPDRTLAAALAATGAHTRIRVKILAQLGRWALVTDGTATASISIPPGLLAGHELADDGEAVFTTLHWARSERGRPEQWPVQTLVATGVYDPPR